MRHLESRLTDPVWLKEQEINKRWANLKEAVFMADDDTTLDDAIKRVEMLYTLKKNHKL